MNKMDEYYSEHPTAGVRTMRSMPSSRNRSERETCQTADEEDGHQTIYPQKKLTKQGQPSTSIRIY